MSAAPPTGETGWEAAATRRGPAMTSRTRIAIGLVGIGLLAAVPFVVLVVCAARLAALLIEPPATKGVRV